MILLQDIQLQCHHTSGTGAHYVLVDEEGQPIHEKSDAEGHETDESQRASQQLLDTALDEIQKNQVSEAIAAGGDSSQLLRLLSHSSTANSMQYFPEVFHRVHKCMH